jgi:hypothetical protein
LPDAIFPDGPKSRNGILRAGTNFLVANYERQKIVAMPKVAIFEEATARTLKIPSGVRMTQEYKYM